MTAVIDDARRRQRRRRIAAAGAIAIACAAIGIVLAVVATGGGGKPAVRSAAPQSIQVWKRADGTRMAVLLPFRDTANCPGRLVPPNLSGAKRRIWFRDSSQRAVQIWMAAPPGCGR